jgi:hypothetical protein
MSDDIGEGNGGAKHFVQMLVCIKYKTPGVDQIFHTGFAIGADSNAVDILEPDETGSSRIESMRMAGTNSIG